MRRGYPPGALRRDMRHIRRILKDLRKKKAGKLRWTRVWAVWAMDFGVAPKAKAGGVKNFLVVRDLASRFTLSAKAVKGQDAVSTMEELLLLFSYYGRPLVSKADNESAFISREMRNFLKNAGVYLMLSPVRGPSYNGGAENAINDVKEYADHHAALHGRLNHWTQEDLSWAHEQTKTYLESTDLADRRALRNALVGSGFLRIEGETFSSN